MDRSGLEYLQHGSVGTFFSRSDFKHWALRFMCVEVLGFRCNSLRTAPLLSG